MYSSEMMKIENKREGKWDEQFSTLGDFLTAEFDNLNISKLKE